MILILVKEEKRALQAKKLLDDEILDRNALSITLLPESPEDEIAAKTTEFVGLNQFISTVELFPRIHIQKSQHIYIPLKTQF